MVYAHTTAKLRKKQKNDHAKHPVLQTQRKIIDGTQSPPHHLADLARSSILCMLQRDSMCLPISCKLGHHRGFYLSRASNLLATSRFASARRSNCSMFQIMYWISSCRSA